jgi:hypothetical protein
MSNNMKRALLGGLTMLVVLAILGAGSGLAARRAVLLEQVTNAGCG